MSTVVDVKVKLFEIAYQGAVAAVGSPQPNLPLGALDDKGVFKLSPEVQARNLAIWESFKEHYNGLVKGLPDNPTVFPDPVVPTVAASLPAVGSELGQIANAVAGVAGVIGPVVPAAVPVAIAAGLAGQALK